MSTPPPMPLRRSLFVDVVAWMAIGMSAFASLMLLLEILLLPRISELVLHQPMGQMTLPPSVSPAGAWFVRNTTLVCNGLLVLALVHLIAGIGLLRRLAWARPFFLGLMVVDMLYQIARAAAQWWVIPPLQRAMLQVQFESMAAQPGNVSSAFQASQLLRMTTMMDSMLLVTRWLSVIATIVCIVLLCWIIRRLQREPIRREFTPASDTL